MFKRSNILVNLFFSSKCFTLSDAKFLYYEISFRSCRTRRGDLPKHTRKGDLVWLTRRLELYVVLMFNVPITKIPAIGLLHLLPRIYSAGT